jgi:hypothetical protein
VINRLKNTPVRKVIRALEKDGFEYKKRKAKEFIAILMVAVLLFIITTPKTPFLVGPCKVFSVVQNGMKLILNGLA